MIAKLTPATELFFSKWPQDDGAPLTPENVIATRPAVKELFLSFAAKPRADICITETKVQGYQHEVTLRCFTPETLVDVEKRPTMIYYPGHGFVSDLDGLQDAPCAEIAYHGNIQVILVTNTWLAPEHRFPKGREDAKAVFSNIIANAKQYHVDEDYVFIGGDSSGGTYVLQVTLAYPKLVNQLYLIAAHIDISGDSLVNASEEVRYAQSLDVMLTPAKIGMLDALYLPEGMDSRSPDCSPLYTDFKQYRDIFPRTTVVILECDGIRGEGELLVTKLKKANIEVRRELIQGLPHNGMLCRAPGAITDGVNPAVRVGELLKTSF